MEINGINNKNELYAHIISELKKLGVKHKEKKIKIVQSKSCSQRLFRTPLHVLQLTEAFLASGKLVKVPKFIADACSCIIDQVEVEGLFRKAGSTIKQREIRKSLEAGLPLEKSHRVIDIANIVSYFFRELPEPLIPTHIHESLIQSLLIGQNCVNALLLVCLLLPTLTLNTMAYFMQFLYAVSLHSKTNKMCTENLAIVLAPGVMPHPDINSVRFKNHIKIVKLLIENANDIGTIPLYISVRLQQQPMVYPKTPNSSSSHQYNRNDEHGQGPQKKKKRRSEMFNGLKKIVGSAIGSSERLDSDTDVIGGGGNHKKVTTTAAAAAADEYGKCATPSNSKISMKRKFADPVSAFSAKKKKDFLALLPSNNGNNALVPKDTKSRTSLGVGGGGGGGAGGGNRNINKNIGINPIVATMERRWSLVSTGWTKHKKKEILLARNNAQSSQNILTEEFVDLPEKHLVNQNSDFESIEENSLTDEQQLVQYAGSIRVSKNEYDDIEKRVAAIETRISEEFGIVRRSLSDNGLDISNSACAETEKVETKYQKMLTDTEKLATPATDELAQRLGRELKIRRNIDQRVIRSPSARKIGTIRRRSQDHKGGRQLSRTQTWHISSKLIPSTYATDTSDKDADSNAVFYAKRNLKRGQPNTIQTGLQTPNPKQGTADVEDISQTEHWTPAENFFKNSQNNPPNQPQQLDQCLEMEEKSITLLHTPVVSDLMLQTPRTTKANPRNTNIHTPMLPPRSVTRKFPNTASKLSNARRMGMGTPMDEDGNGRASIARLRSQNAGMVLAKAKLFDDMNENDAADLNLVKPNLMSNKLNSKFQATRNTPIRAMQQGPVPNPLSHTNSVTQQKVKSADLTMKPTNKRNSLLLSSNKQILVNDQRKLIKEIIHNDPSSSKGIKCGQQQQPQQQSTTNPVKTYKTIKNIHLSSVTSVAPVHQNILIISPKKNRNIIDPPSSSSSSSHRTQSPYIKKAKLIRKY